MLLELYIKLNRLHTFSHSPRVPSLPSSHINLGGSWQESRNMVDTRVMVVFALLQITCFLFHNVSAATCHVSGFIHGKGRNCDRETGLDKCCIAGKRYPQFRCSPPVSAKTPAILTFNRFENGEDATRITSCDMRFHRGVNLRVV